MSLNTKGNLHYCTKQEPVFVSKTNSVSLGEPTQRRTSWELSRRGRLASLTHRQVSSQNRWDFFALQHKTWNKDQRWGYV